MAKGPTGTIDGPDQPASLGATLTFHVTYDGFKGQVKPYVYAEAYQDGLLVYGELKPVLSLSTSVNFPKFGYDSEWSADGGPADCQVSLVAYGGLVHGGTQATLDTVTFHATG